MKIRMESKIVVIRAIHCILSHLLYILRHFLGYNMS